MEKKKRGRPPKIFTAETDGMTYEGVINYALDRQVKSELDKSLKNCQSKHLETSTVITAEEFINGGEKVEPAETENLP